MSVASDQLKALVDKVSPGSLPQKLKESVLIRLDQLSRLTSSPTFLPEFDRINTYIDWILDLPWEKRTNDLLDLDHAKVVLDKNHNGLFEIKERILEYISVMKLEEGKGEKDVFFH